MNKYNNKAVWAINLVVIPILIYILGIFLLQVKDIPGAAESIAFVIVFIGVLMLPVFSITGLILGVLSLKDMRRSTTLKGRTLATIAIVLSIAVIVMVPILIVVLRSSWS